MCGIVYAEDFTGKPVNNDIMQVFDKQRHRGTEGFGLFDGQEMNMVHETKENKILKWLVKYNSNLVMFHHRNPSSTINVKKASHPFSTRDFFGDTQYVLVHNGHIYNSYELADEHETEYGVEYQSILDNGTFNDSEALLWDLALVLEGHKQSLDTEGAVAFICLKIVKGKLERMYFGRNTSPLRLVRTDTRFELHSEGEGEMIEDNVLYNYNYAKKRLSQRAFIIPEKFNAVKDSRWDDDYGYKPQEYTPKGYLPAPVPKPYQEDTQNWLPEHLRKKAAEIRAKKYGAPELDPNFIDYDRDGNPVYFNPHDDKEFKSYDDYYSQRKAREAQATLLTDEQEEELEAIVPDESVVYQLAFDYMCQSEGNFEQAYFFVEQDYEQLFDTPQEEQDHAYMEQVRTLELVMQEINSDPEYVNEQSVSSTWLPLQNRMMQQELINA